MITKMNLQGKKVTVMGLGLHGGALGNIRWLISQGAQVTATDMKAEKDLAMTVKKVKEEFGDQVKLVLGEHREEDFVNADLIIRNPAVPRKSKYLELARTKGIPVEMDSSLFFEYSPSKNIIGVTGSKGKTTTANAIAVLLKAANPQTVAVGIDGISPLAELPNIQADSPVIFELSSWRLEALDEHKISPHIAVVTSLYRDHLNTYNSFEEYIATKKVIIKYQTKDDIVILNYDDPLIRKWASEVKGKLYWYSMGELPAGEEGIGVRDGKIYLTTQPHPNPLLSKEREYQPAKPGTSPYLRRGRPGGPGEVLMESQNLPLKSTHEHRNLLPAILIAHFFGISTEKIKREIKNLRGLPHRLEKVRELDGVTYINDSAATMPDATIAALKSLTGKSIVHIIGGSDKNLQFEELAKEEIKTNIRALVWLPGTATEKMQQVMGAKWRSVDVRSMSEAVAQAAKLAQPGDLILLSPGATSFGLFAHEFDRGNQFRRAVLDLPAVRAGT